MKCYVHACTAYYHTKLPNEKLYSLLQQLEIPCHHWRHININFIIKLSPTTPDELPNHGGNNIIITSINALTKRAHWVAASTATWYSRRPGQLMPVFQESLPSRSGCGHVSTTSHSTGAWEGRRMEDYESSTRSLRLRTAGFISQLKYVGWEGQESVPVPRRGRRGPHQWWPQF